MKRNSKILIVFFFITLSFVFLSTEVMAFSLELRGGGGFMQASGERRSYFIQGGIDAFIYEGRLLDIFVGAEFTDIGAEYEILPEKLSVDLSVDSSIVITAATFGLRLKIATRGRWKPYLSLGGIGGSVDYEVSGIDNDNFKLLTTTSDSTTFMTYRAGLGTDIGFGTRWSLGLEANYTGEVPAFKMVVGDVSSGEVEEITLNEGSSMMGLILGLKYSF